jgi:exonuclease SbcD
VSSIKILHTADWHVGRTIRGRSRVDEHRAVLAEMAAVAADRSVDVVLVAGDVFDVAAPTAEAEQVVYRALLDLADVAPVVVVAGNHDNPRRLAAVAPLLELGRVRVAGRIRRPDQGGVISDLGLPVRIALLPWQSQRGIVSASDLMFKDAVDQVQDYAGRMRRVIEAMTGGLTTDTVNIALSHVMVYGPTPRGANATPTSSGTPSLRPPSPVRCHTWPLAICIVVSRSRARLRCGTPGRPCSSTSARPAMTRGFWLWRHHPDCRR